MVNIIVELRGFFRSLAFEMTETLHSCKANNYKITVTAMFHL